MVYSDAEEEDDPLVSGDLEYINIQPDIQTVTYESCCVKRARAEKKKTPMDVAKSIGKRLRTKKMISYKE